ncbi:type II toxin-antitoxin system VapC family toxin [Candidatus Parcubacteria bacterium]|nr:type II toxin-antitoxin system VapC family toxin [Candidatus Parcubacteria bacterium]
MLKKIKIKIKIKWYYDACTLDEKVYKKIFQDVTSSKHPVMAVLSHLALGEVYGNLFSKKGKKQMDVFTDFLEALKRQRRIEIAGNDGVEEILERVQGVLSSERNDFTDLVHIATAIGCGCSNILSDDRGLTGIETNKKDKIKKIAQEERGINDFGITWLKVK